MMIKFSVGIIFCFCFICQVTAQTKMFELIDVNQHSDIDKNQIGKIGNYAPDTSLLSNVFKPVKGRYTVYRFLTSYIGISMNNEQRSFHDCIILKTDEHKKIIEGYYYNIEIYNPPNAKALFKSTSSNLFLKEKMDVNSFKFKRKKYSDPEDQELNDDGIINLRSNRVKVI